MKVDTVFLILASARETVINGAVDHLQVVRRVERQYGRQLNGTLLRRLRHGSPGGGFAVPFGV